MAARTGSARSAGGAGGATRTGAPEPRLRGRLPVLWRSATEVQLGTDPRWALALGDLTPAAARALRDLPAEADRRTTAAALRRAGAADAEVAAVLAALTAGRALVTGPAPASAEEAAWSLLQEDGDGARVLARRARAAVEVRGLGRVGAIVAGCLATAGVGTVVPVDEAPVERGDVAAGGLRVQDVGLARAAAVARLLHAGAPGVRTAGAGPADLAVLVEHHAADPVTYGELLTGARPHLSVVVREASVLVGPLVVPGVTPCLRCLDLERTRRDGRWPSVAAQLTRAAPAAQEATVAATAGALAAAQALAFVDGRPVAVRGASLVVALPDAVPRLVRWAADPACGCAGPPEAPPTSPPRAGVAAGAAPPP